MSKATEKQVRDLEKAHKEALVNLIMAAKLRLALARKYGLQDQKFLTYNKIYWDAAKAWFDRQVLLAKAGVPQELYAEDMQSATGIKKMEALALKWDSQGKGVGGEKKIGFIPLLIWGVVSIVLMFTGEQIVDELNNTAEEQAALIAKTSDFCKANGLTPDECKKLIDSQTAATKKDEGFMSEIKKLLAWGGLGFIAYKIATNNSK